MLVDKILELNNSTLIMFLMRLLLYSDKYIYIYKNKKPKMENTKYMKKIQEYLKSHKILIHKENCYTYILDLLNIDYIELYDDNINSHYIDFIKK